jgi:hypothetical protein
MDDTPNRPAYKKRHKFARLKAVLTGRNKGKDMPSDTPGTRTSELTTTLGANRGGVKPEADNSKTDDYDAKDHWKTAYDALSESDRNTLATLLPAMTTEPQDAGRARTREILDQVVKATETQYKEDPRKDVIWATAHKILNSALSFQDVINNAVRFDPTGYASSAWAIVSLGLTV